jgi:filamentous hemagglutinin family protein
MALDRGLKKLLLATASAGAFLTVQTAWANPDGATVVTGDVSISGIGSDHVIIQNDSMRSIVDWNSFSIGTGETTTFNQLSNDAAILNRVTGGNITEIYGTLESNGQVFLINENGILIGESGLVDTNGFVASTLDVSNADFLGAGDMVFRQGIETGGGITVHGKIRSISGGDIFLLSREIEIGEKGVIDSNGGYVGLGAGEEILLKPTDTGDGRISIRAGKGKIVNRGSISGAVAELKAAGGNAYALAINNTGVVRATGAVKKGGRVMLTGGGKVKNTGTIKATRKVVVRSTKKIVNKGKVQAGDANKGGEIIFEAPEIVVQAGSLLDVSGALGGGRMFIGGGFQGTDKARNGDLVDISQNAGIVTVEAGAVLTASATQSGDAGDIVVWADGTTSFAGAAIADGGKGFIEISGREHIDYRGSVSAKGGLVLFDPGTVEIVADSDNDGIPDFADASQTLGADADGDGIDDAFDVDGGTNNDPTLAGLAAGVLTDRFVDSAIEASLQGGTSLTILTSSATGALGGAEDINILAGVRVFWTNDGSLSNGNATLTLQAGNDINALDDVIIQNSGSGDVDTDEGGVVFIAGNDINIGSAANRTGLVAIGSEFGVNNFIASGDVTVRGGDTDTLGQGVDHASAQIGYTLDGNRPDNDRNGTISVNAGGDITVQGGQAPATYDGRGNFAQIGHGGANGPEDTFAAEEVNGNINVEAVGDLVIQGGADSVSAAVIGHGAIITNFNRSGGGIAGDGIFSQGGVSGNISVNADNISINANYVPVDGSASTTTGDGDSVIGRIGHGAIFDVGDWISNISPDLAFGRIQGSIDVTALGDLVVGTSVAPADTVNDRLFISSVIGHGSTGTISFHAAIGGSHSGENTITHGDIMGFDTGADQDEDADYGTDITIRAGSTTVQSVITSDGLANTNILRAQIGHTPTSRLNDAGETSTAGHSIVVIENHIAGDIAIYDTDKTDASGVTVNSSITAGGTNPADFDVAIARIGHASAQFITGLDGHATGANASNVSIFQAHILGADILVDTVTQGTAGTGDDATEGDNQDVTLTTAIAAGLLPAADNTAVASIGHGGDTFVTTGMGGAAATADGDAGDGGDITIARGTVWDGGLRANDTDTDYREPNSTDITILSSNQIIVDSATTAGLAAADRNNAESSIGHGFKIRLDTGDGGSNGAGQGSGGAGGDVLVYQGVDARDYGLNEGFDDWARGIRGEIFLSAHAETAASGPMAISITSADTAALAGTNFNTAISTVGHSDVIEISTGNGGDGSAMAAGNLDLADNEGDDRTVAGADQLDAHGGRGGHIDVQLGRYQSVGQAGVIIARGQRNNLADIGDRRLAQQGRQGVMLIEGDITVEAWGTVLVDSAVNNALAPANHALVESVIGHGTRMTADSGDGGNGGSGNFQASEEPVFASEKAGETFLNYASGQGSNRGGNGGDIRLTQGDITSRFVHDRTIRHDTDADNRNGADIVLNISDELGSTLADSLILTSAVNGGLAEGNGANVASLVGHHVRMTAEGGAGGNGGSSNTEFDADGNSLFSDGTGQTDANGSNDGNDETAVQAGAVYIQPNSSGGRGGDAFVVNGNIRGDIAVIADRRVTISTTAGHGQYSIVASQVGHTADLLAATQAGGTAGRLFEAPDLEAIFDGGVINVGGTQTGENASPASFNHVLIDGNRDDKFNLNGIGDENSTRGEDGVAVTASDIANRTGSTFSSIAADPVLGVNVAGTAPGTTTGVIFHDEEADPQYIIDPNTGLLVANTEANNALYAEDPVNLGRFGRVVATYDGYTDEEFNDLSLPVFVDMDQDGDVDLVDFDRDGRFDIVDLDHDGLMDQIDGRANYVVSGSYKNITGLGVLDYAAVSGVNFDPAHVEGGWTLRNQLTTTDLLGAYNGTGGSTFTALVGDFSTANGGRGGDAYTQTGYIAGDISVSTGNNDMGEPTSLVVSVNLLDDPVAGGGFDHHRAQIGHGGIQISDAVSEQALRRAGREGIDGDADIHAAANGGNANFYAINASGGRGGNAALVQGVARDNDPDRDAATVETDHLVGHVFINTPNHLDGSNSSGAKRLDFTSFVDNDYGNNIAIVQAGHGATAFAHAGSGGAGASHQGPTEGPNGSSQTEIANGGDAGDALILQHHVKGEIFVMTGADDGDGTMDVSLQLTAQNGPAIAVPGNENTILSRIGHGRLAGATGGNGGTADDAQWLANGGTGGNASVDQRAILDTRIVIDLVDPARGYFGNGMLIAAEDFHDSGDIVRAQVGMGDLAVAAGGSGGDGTPEWVVNEQRNQEANGGNGGDAMVTQAGYNYDITLDIGHNVLAGWALEIRASEANLFDGANDHTLATVGHGGMALALGGAGGNGGLEGAVNSLQTGIDPNLVDSDYWYGDTPADGDTPNAIDLANGFHLGTDRRGGHGGNALVSMNAQGTGRNIAGRESGNYDYGRDDTNGADITIHTNDDNDAGSAGYDGIWIHTLAGPGTNQDSALEVLASVVGHHGFGEATGGAGGNGIQSTLASVITEGDGGDGGAGSVTLAAIRGDVSITNTGNPMGAFDDSGDDRSTNIIIESMGGSIADAVTNRAEARAGHFTQVMATGGAGGNASSEAGAPPSFAASLSAQGGDGGDAFTWQGQLEGDITLTAENSVIVRALDGQISPQVTVAAIGHRETARVYGGTGGFGGTAAAEANAQSIYFIYEALREYHHRGNNYAALSAFEQKLVDPFLDYFADKPGELDIFLDKLVGGTNGVIEANARDDDAVGGTDFSIAPLVAGTGHIAGAMDGEIETMLHILAASGHGGDAIVRQGSAGLGGGVSDVLSASGDISVTALSYDVSDAARGYTQLASADALAGGMMMTHLGHQAEVYAAIAGNGQNLNGQNADANGIGGDGGDAIADQYAINGGIDVVSLHKITIQAMDVGPDAQEARSHVGHRLNIGSDFTGYRPAFAIQSGNGGGESNDVFDDGRNGNGGDVYVWQRGVISGTLRGGGTEARYSTEIQLAALEDSDDDISITIEALAVGPLAPDVETHIGHDFLIASAKAGDAGRQGALTGPTGASEGLLEGNGGDIFIAQTDLGADIDIIGRDAVAITSMTSTSGANWANLTIGHQRTVGESGDSDNPRSGLIVAGLGGDAHVEDVNATDLANADAAAKGILEDADSGRIEIVLGKITDSFEASGDDQRLITITSITEDVDVLSQTAMGTSHLEIGNQQHVIAATAEAGDYTGVPFLQTAGDSGGVYIARDTISGDILLQALDADRANSLAPADGKQVTVKTLANIGDAQAQVGHETEFTVTTGRSGFGEDRNFLADSNLAAFAGLIDPASVADSVAGQATLADAQNAVEDMEDLVNALELAMRYADRLPADDGVNDANDRGDLLRAYSAAQRALADAQQALATIGGGISTEQAVSRVQTQALNLIAARDAFQTVYDTIPQAGSLVADFADAGDIVYGDLALRNRAYGDAGLVSSTLPAAIGDTGMVTGDVRLYSGRYAGTVNDWRDVSGIVGNDAIVASNFGGAGFTTADDMDDGVVHVEANTVLGVTLTEIGHRRFMVNTTGKGGGDTDAAPEEGGVAGDGGSIVSANTTRGDVYLKAEEVVVTVLGAAGTAETHLGHSDWLVNTAYWSDIQSLMGSGGDIDNTTIVSGGVQIEAERIASAVDAQDRKLLATGLADSYLHMGHQVTTVNESKSDPVEPANLGDTQDNLGSNRGGQVTSTQIVAGNNGALRGTGSDTEGNGGDGIEDGVLVSILLDANGDGVEGDLIIETGGAAPSRIRLGNAGQTAPGAAETSTALTTLLHSGVSGANESDDGDTVTLTQRVGGDVVISSVEDLAVRVAGASPNDIWIGHDATQGGISGQTNAPAGTIPQYGERVTVLQAVTGDLRFDPWSSFEASIGAASPGELHIGHEATQSAFSADDSGEPSDFDMDDNGASAGGVNDGFTRPDVLATQTVDADISITSGEILLSNANSTRLQVGHEAFHSAAADGDKPGVEPSRAGVQNPLAGLPSGFVVATSIINGDGSDIVFTATGATGQVDTVLVATNGTEGDITLEDVIAAGEVQVGHRSTSTMSDNTPALVAEGFYQTLQGIGSTTLDANGEAVNTGHSVIAFNAVQDIELLDKIGGTVQVGHFIVETGASISTTSPVATNPDNAITDSANDSLLRQIVGSDILFGSNASQGRGGVGTGGAGNNLVMLTTGGRSMIGHMSPATNEWQVEDGARSVTRQLLDGDIIVEAGTDAGVDAPNGATTPAGDESGLGDDILLDATAGGVVRIGHNQANEVEGIANETQVSAGDIWVRAGGDLHVLAASIGHENYDFTTVAEAKANATPESLASAAPVRNRIRGNTTIGAGQNSAVEDSTLIANIMVFDGSVAPVQVNSGYGGQGNADVDGELRFFLPAQEGLTIVNPVTFNDSASNGDATADRSGDPSNVFEGQGGANHEHPFTFMAAGAPYTDQFIGLGNFTFYFEPQPVDDFPAYTPYLNLFDLDSGFTVVFGNTGPRQQGSVNIGSLAGSHYLGTSSMEVMCEELVEREVIDNVEECDMPWQENQGLQNGYGSANGFSSKAGGNQNFPGIVQRSRPDADGNSVFGNHWTQSGSTVYRSIRRSDAGAVLPGVNLPSQAGTGDGLILPDVSVQPAEATARLQQGGVWTVGTTVHSSAARVRGPLEGDFAEYVSGELAARQQLQAAYPGAMSMATSYSVFEEKPL